MSFNRRGDSLGGATDSSPFPRYPKSHGFNRRGDSLGGATGSSSGKSVFKARFNRRGDSLGGATLCRVGRLRMATVSIAEAILWGEQHTSDGYGRGYFAVSIAEAILWGEQPANGAGDNVTHNCFNRRGDSLGGATPACPASV